jgi:hypothetical protein
VVVQERKRKRIEEKGEEKGEGKHLDTRSRKVGGRSGWSVSR